MRPRTEDKNTAYAVIMERLPGTAEEIELESFIVAGRKAVAELVKKLRDGGKYRVVMIREAEKGEAPEVARGSRKRFLERQSERTSGANKQPKKK
jgi:hypothetical protein